MSDFPGPKINLITALPSLIMGDSPIAKDPVGTAEKLFDEFGDTVLIDSGIRRVYFTRDTSLIRHVLIENPRRYPKATPYEHASLFLGKGILNSEGDFWREQRSMVQPGFSKTPLHRFVAVMKETSSRAALKIADGPIDVSSLSMHIALENICQFLFGDDFSKHEQIIRDGVHFGNEFLSQRIRSLLPLPIELPLPSHLIFRYYKWRIDQVIYQMIDERQNQSEAGHDLASMLIAAEKKASNGEVRREQVRDELITLLVAGHETTGYTLAMVFYMLAQNPKIQQRLWIELSEKIGSPDDISADSLDGCIYLTAVLEETLRLFPAAWIMGRKIAEDEIWESKLLRGGSEFHVVIQGLHCDRKYWVDGKIFNPDRFLPENAASVNKHAYIPFGVGPRKCIGSQFAMLEMQVAVARLLLQYRLEAIAKSVPQIEYLFTARLKSALNIKFVKR